MKQIGLFFGIAFGVILFAGCSSEGTGFATVSVSESNALHTLQDVYVDYTTIFETGSQYGQATPEKGIQLAYVSGNVKEIGDFGPEIDGEDRNQEYWPDQIHFALRYSSRKNDGSIGIHRFVSNYQIGFEFLTNQSIPHTTVAYMMVWQNQSYYAKSYAFNQDATNTIRFVPTNSQMNSELKIIEMTQRPDQLSFIEIGSESNPCQPKADAAYTCDVTVTAVDGFSLKKHLFTSTITIDFTSRTPLKSRLYRASGDPVGYVEAHSIVVTSSGTGITYKALSVTVLNPDGKRFDAWNPWNPEVPNS